MTIERKAGLKDDQVYSIVVYNEATKKQVKGITITGKELQFLARALDGLVRQQMVYEGIEQKQEELHRESQQKVDESLPTTGDNPLGKGYDGGDGSGYESTFLTPNQPQNPQFNQPNPNEGGIRSITDNPDNVKPPKLP